MVANCTRKPSPRKVRPQRDRPDWVVFTDAATATSMIAAVTIRRDDFMTNEQIQQILATTTGEYWIKLFDAANIIYGLEMISLMETLYAPNCPLSNSNVTFHIDNRNAFGALVRNNSNSTVIISMAQLIWCKIRDIGITAWFEWVPGNRNIADLPTRGVQTPLKCLGGREFGDLRSLRRIIQNATHAMESGRPITLPRELPTFPSGPSAL